MSDQGNGDFILGVDLGCNSLGWAIIRLVDDNPAGLICAGVRVFEAGVNIDPKSGKEETRNAQRREARLHRRQLWRRWRRLRKIFNLLQHFGLLPSGDASTPEKRQKFINALDETIRASEWFRAKSPTYDKGKKLCPECDRLREGPRAKRKRKCCLVCDRLRQVMPYLLRASALDEPLEPPFLGRALYHLAQRRGFWSNRKSPAKKDEKPGEVEKDIRSLRAEMETAEARTLGEYLAGLSPFDRRIRDRWTARDMYQKEFKAIWERQAKDHHDLLTERAHRVLYDALFDQRRMKIKRGLVGRCEFESEERRAPAYLLISQRFRLLQVVNNLKVRAFAGQDVPLSLEKRTELISALERRSAMEFKEVRELLGLTRRYSINLQRDKEEARMPGNDTGAQFCSEKLFGERWFDFSPQDQDRIVADAQSILSVRDADERRKRAEKYLQKRGVANLEDASEEFLAIAFEAGYRSLSVRAMRRFIPLLERGFPYGALERHYRHLSDETAQRLIGLADKGVPCLQACEQVLTAPPERHKSLKFLPPVTAEETAGYVGVIRNPIVIRSLTELRKVVNAVIEKFNRPARVHIELLRELRKPKQAREKIWKENFSRERTNEAIRKKIHDDARIPLPSPKDVEKHKLWLECGNICPYCLKGMSWPNLFGDDSDYQVDHIIPWKRCLDDSFANKVLCHAECNRKKGDRTPYEAFSPAHGGEADHYDAIKSWVKRFKGDKDMIETKARRFGMDEKGLEEFLAKLNAQQFNDSAYASRLAADYLGLLYGGRQDEDSSLRVQVRTGGLTKYFREAWKLNSILGDGEYKNGGRTPKPRFDHRHHALDAAVIAVADQGMVERLNNAAKRGWLDRPGRFGNFDEPWPGFRNDLKRELIEKVVVSHRVSGRVSGALHKDTNYSAKDSSEGFRRLRILVSELSERDLRHDENLKRDEEPVIADRGVRLRVVQKWKDLGRGDPKKLKSNLPCFETEDGRRIPIKSLRIRSRIATEKVGRGPTLRHVKPDSNHHIEVFRSVGKKGQETWTGCIVDMLEAYQRKQRRVPIINPEGKPNFLFSLCPGETLLCHRGEHQGKLFVVRGMRSDERRVLMVPVNDARMKSEIEKARAYLTPSVETLHRWDVRKAVVSPIGELQMRELKVSPLGEVSDAHD